MLDRKFDNVPVTGAVMARVMEGLGKATREALWKELRADHAMYTKRFNYLSARIAALEEKLGIAPTTPRPE